MAGETSCLSIDPIMREAIETGPTARSLELPRTAYMSGGTKLESTILINSSCMRKVTAKPTEVVQICRSCISDK